MIKLEFSLFSGGDAENPVTEAASKSNATKYRNRAIQGRHTRMGALGPTHGRQRKGAPNVAFF